jgi:hypothetical protein
MGMLLVGLALSAATLIYYVLRFSDAPAPDNGLDGVSTNRNLIVIRDDYGGDVSVYQRRYAVIAQMGFQVVIDGICASACTHILWEVPPEQVCVTDAAWFGFHMASIGARPSVELTRELNSHYPAVVQDWIAEHGPLTEAAILMPASDLHGFYQLCHW